MALKKCSNCDKDFITEADIFVYQNKPSGEYYSCGCVEFKKCKALACGECGFDIGKVGRLITVDMCFMDDELGIFCPECSEWIELNKT